MNHTMQAQRPMVFVFALALIALCMTAPAAQAQGVMNVDQTINITELGDATFVMRMSFTASQFQQWQQRYGMNPSLLRREMAKTMTPYDITDFQLEKNEMDREITITIKARGVTINRGNGRTEIEVPKNWRLVDQDAHELKFNYLEPVGNGVTLQGNVTTKLPAAASDISEPVPAEGGMKRITYYMPVAAGSSSMGLIFGVVLVIAGAALTAVGLLKGKSKPA